MELIHLANMSLIMYFQVNHDHRLSDEELASSSSDSMFSIEIYNNFDELLPGGVYNFNDLFRICTVSLALNTDNYMDNLSEILIIFGTIFGKVYNKTTARIYIRYEQF